MFGLLTTIIIGFCRRRDCEANHARQGKHGIHRDDVARYRRFDRRDLWRSGGGLV